MTDYAVDKTSVLSSADFLVQYLRDSGFTGSVENGTALYDQVIVPIGLLFALFREELKKTRAYLSLDAAIQESDDLGTEADAAIDAVLSNWFVDRNAGTPASGTLNLVFSTPQTYMVFNPGTTYFYIDGTPFTVPSKKVVFEDSFISTANTVNNTTEYTLPLEVVAQESKAMVIGVSDSVVSAVDNVYLLRVEVAAAFASGTDKESNDDFIDRTLKVINTRELISDRAITTVLRDQLPDIKEIFVAGYGHDAQIRDIKTFDNITCHIGNKADIYAFVNLQATYVDIPYDDDTETSFTVSDYTEGKPIVDLLKAEDVDGYTQYAKLYFVDDSAVSLAWATDILKKGSVEYALNRDYSFTSGDFADDTYDGTAFKSVKVTLKYSAMTEPIKAGDTLEFVNTPPTGFLGGVAIITDESGDDIYPITLGAVDEGLFGTCGLEVTCTVANFAKSSAGTRRIYYLTSQTVEDAHDLVYSDAQRVTNHDPAVKSPYPIQLSMSLTVTTNAAVSASDVKDAAVSYTRGIKQGSVFTISNLVDAIHTNTVGVVSVNMPITVSYKFRDPKTGNYETGKITDQFSLPAGSYSDQLHTDTITFYTDDDSITVTVTPEAS